MCFTQLVWNYSKSKYVWNLLKVNNKDNSVASWRHFVCVFFFLTLHILVPFDYAANIFKELNKLFPVFFLLSRHVQIGHPILVTQVDLILQNWGEFKVFETLGLNRLSCCTHLLWKTTLFTIFDFLLEILENLW